MVASITNIENTEGGTSLGSPTQGHVDLKVSVE